MSYIAAQNLKNCENQHTVNTLCLQKNDTDVAYYNFNAHQLIFVIFGRDVADRVC